MTTEKKYIDFILDNFIGDSIKVELPKTTEDGRLMWVKIGAVVLVEVKLEIIEKYTRSAKIKLIFDRYEIEQLFFFPLESAPTKIQERFEEKVSKIVCDTFFNDNRHEDVLKMYKEKINNGTIYKRKLGV
jgi:hypothetical protein